MINKLCDLLNDKDTHVTQIALQLIKKIIRNSPKPS